ncbi:MAG: hypothetical protein M3Z09_10740 [Acidobacteriota bacterium]|nr:hypothetical protein [Acidobacteriota bacterium]
MELKRWLLLSVIGVSSLYAAPQLQLSTTALGPINIAGGTNGPVQTVQVTNIGDGTLNVSATASATWLVPSPGSGNLQIALNTSKLAPGSYTEFVTVNSPGAVDSPQNISVTVQIGGVPDKLEFYAAPNGGTATKQFQAQSVLRATTSTSDGRPWLSVFGQGSFTFFYPYLVTATSQTGQPEGDYTGTVSLTGGANPSDNRNIAVTLHVTSMPILQFGAASPLRLNGVAGGSKVNQTVPVQNIGGTASTLTVSGGTAITSAGGSFLSVSALNNGQVTITADPAALQPGIYSGSITLTSNAANAAATPLPVQFVVSPATVPNISFGGVVDNTTFKPVLAPGAIASLFGSQLFGDTPASASSLPLTTTLSGVRVFVNNVAAPVYYASSGQINFQVPQTTQAGPAQISVMYNGRQGNIVTTAIQARAPRILRLGVGNYGIIVNQDGSFPMPVTPGYNSHPAKIGDVLTIYAIGMGVTTPAVTDGAGAPASEPLARTPLPAVTFGGGFAGTPTQGQVFYSGLTPGFVGLYQVNVSIPDGTPYGDAIGLQFSVEGATSNNVFLAIAK